LAIPGNAAIGTSATALNTRACKLLLLEYAFDIAGRGRSGVFGTHWHKNSVRGQRLARLGAKQDGVLRNHRIEAGVGPTRDTVVFSILEISEMAGWWPIIALFRLAARN